MPRSAQKQRGQSLIILALAMVGSVAFLALVLDLGFVFAERRQAQNAADAGALAGMRAFMRGYTDTLVLNEIVQYVGQNGIPDPANNVTAAYITITLSSLEPSFLATVGSLGSGSPPTLTTGLVVTVTRESSTFFAGIGEIGRSSIAVSARAIVGIRTPAIAPIAVNEYAGHTSQPTSTIVSYVRSGPNFGNEFPFLGSGTEPWSGSSDFRSFVDLDIRTDTYSPDNFATWYKVLPDGTWTNPTNPELSGSNDRVDANLEYIAQGGYTAAADDLPVAVSEISPGSYTPASAPGNPYAVVNTFSGVKAGQAIDEMKANDYQNGTYAPGRTLAVLVYDGAIVGGGTAKAAVVVGYARIRITRYTANAVYGVAVLPVSSKLTSILTFEDVKLFR